MSVRLVRPPRGSARERRDVGPLVIPPLTRRATNETGLDRTTAAGQIARSFHYSRRARTRLTPNAVQAFVATMRSPIFLFIACVVFLAARIFAGEDTEPSTHMKEVL